MMYLSAIKEAFNMPIVSVTIHDSAAPDQVITGTPAPPTSSAPILPYASNIIHDQNLKLVKGQVGFDVTGQDKTYRRNTVTGGLQGMLFHASDSITVDTYTATDPDTGYCWYHTGAPGTNTNHWLRKMTGTINKGTSGQHCWRIYGLDNFAAEDVTLTHFGAYTGATLNARQCSDGSFNRLKLYGRPGGLGPDKKPEEEALRCQNVVFRDALLDMNGDFLSTWADASPFTFWSGVSNVMFIGGQAIQRNPAKKIFRCEAAWNSRPAATGITIYGMDLQGGSGVVDGGNPTGIDFVNCVYNGKPFTKVDPKTGAVS